MKRRSFQKTVKHWMWLGLTLACTVIPTSAFAQTPDLVPVQIGAPRIDLQAVEQALWSTQAAKANDFQGWMIRFEDEVNAIYFATLRRQSPLADPATLMPRPVRIDAQRINNMLTIYGYIDQNNMAGYQNGQDLLMFAFEQAKPYDSRARSLAYSLRDGGGYYYRDPSYLYVFPGAMTPAALGFFMYPTVWTGIYWRPVFAWWNTPYWQTGSFYNRATFYYNVYPRFYRHYHRTYYVRYRPWGWRRGTFYRNVKGRFYQRHGRVFRGGERRGYYRGWRRGYRRALRERRRNQRRQARPQRRRGKRGGGGGGGRRRR